MAIDQEKFDPFGDEITDHSEYSDEEFPDVELVPQSEIPPSSEETEAEEVEEQEEIAPEPETKPTGTGKYIVREGECVSKIAFEHGFFWQTLWDDPKNAELREARKDPYLLVVGDRIHIPDLRLRTESCGTESRYRFRRKGVPEQFHLRLIDPKDQPLAQVECCILIDGIHTRKTTDQDGNLRFPIPPNAREARVIVDATGQEIFIALGQLDPIDTWSGACDRLRNLGFDPGDTSAGMTERAREAVRAFQRKYQLRESGEVDEATRSKLREVYGS